jgi:hypothetical protein
MKLKFGIARHFVRRQSIVNKAFKLFALPWTILSLRRAEQAIGLLGDEPGYADHVFIANGKYLCTIIFIYPGAAFAKFGADAQTPVRKI